jgi:hypothetical protein
VRAGNAGRRAKDNVARWVVGDAAFQKSICEKDAHNRLTIARCRKEGITLEDVLRATAMKTDVDSGLILCKSKGTPHSSARMVFCFLAGGLGFPTRETGNFLGIQQAAVTNAARKGALIAKKLKIAW